MVCYHTYIQFEMYHLQHIICSAGKTKGFTNPPENFKMNCAALGGCAEATFNFEYTAATMVEKIHSIIFSEAYSGYNANIVINSYMSRPILLDRLECSDPGSCENLTISGINFQVNDIECKIGACNGCTVVMNGISKACALW